jgi:RNA ligase (TIGR02306 family)
MSDWNPQIVKIEKIEAHPNADNLSIATVLGDYPVVIRTGEYVLDELAVYLPIDTIVPDTNLFYFLCPKNHEKYEEAGEIKTRTLGPKYELGSVPEKYRLIKAKKIRGIYSQGMLVKVDNIPNLTLDFNVTEFFSLKKWEEQEEENIPENKKKGGIAEKPPVGWSIPYYDIEGLRKNLNCLHDDEEVVLLEKLHGSNISFCHDNSTLWVKSRNFYKRKQDNCIWWDVAYRLDLENKLSKYPNMVFFGELYGGVKGFRYDCKIVNGAIETNVAFFDIWDVKSMRYLDYDNVLAILKDLDLTPVPELYRGLWRGKEEMYPYAEGMTCLGGKHIREGFVLKPVKERFEKKLNSRMQFKLVGEGYNLQK